MKILLVAGALTLALVLAGGFPARPLDDLRWQRDRSPAYALAKVGRTETPVQIAMPSSTFERR